MNSSQHPPRSRRKRSPRGADAPSLSIFDLPSPKEVYLGVTAEYSTRAELIEEQRLWLADFCKVSAAVRSPALPSVARPLGSPHIPSSRAHQEMLLRVESVAVIAHRLVHLTSHPTPTVVEARMATRAAADAVGALHTIICPPPLLP
ncbi:hypothetical protein JKF63_00888 [Porcisia hertigi]|uniref:Uncharacterized protein n=1 Tax=Porcisia hertigi TaxID=2761500 RepID=A0A836I5N5_9TRYP|nr:hypothetical protein JKF63_00888 [Porcisia hertigi]